jgi:hypothetical protein
MVIHMGKPIPMKESESSRITIARAMWGRDYAYCRHATRAEYPDCDPFGENSPLSEANLLVLRGFADYWTSSPAAVENRDFLGNLTQQSGGDYS